MWQRSSGIEGGGGAYAAQGGFGLRGEGGRPRRVVESMLREVRSRRDEIHSREMLARGASRPWYLRITQRGWLSYASCSLRLRVAVTAAFLRQLPVLTRI